MSLHCETCGRRIDPKTTGVLVIWKDGCRSAWCAKHAARRPRSVSIPPRGWRFIHGLDRRMRQAEKAEASGELLPWERTRIREGDHSPLIRGKEPALEVGKSLIAAWEYSRRQADPSTGQVITSPAAPSLWVTVTRKVRRAKGGWSIHFDVTDKRHETRYMRRTPPAYAPSHEEVKEISDEEVHIASNYTGDARASVEPVPVIPEDDLNHYAAEARVATILRDSDQTERRLAEIAALPARERLMALHKFASDRGVDVRDDVKAFERRLLRRLGKAA